ncbi:MAG: amidohydrolase family protein [Candidatus Gastranaerophilales bacterium]|nr:amidohydrolase family protein [Candidatus Gastranaerophilales bacterium]
MKTLYKSKWLLPGNRKVIENGGFLVENGVICDIFTAEQLGNIDLSACDTVDFGNATITPGFINTHAHLQYTEIGKKRSKSLVNRLRRLILELRKQLIFKGQNKTFTSWIVDLIIEYMSLSEKERIDSFNSGLRQALSGGTTAIAQLSREEVYFDILNSSPINAYIFFEVYADSEESSEKNFDDFRKKYERLLPKCSKNTFIGISPHAPYNIHRHLWEKIAEYSRQNDVLIHTHFAEAAEEMKWLATGHSDIDKLHKFAMFKHIEPDKKESSAIEYLKTLNLPYNNVILAHVCQLAQEDYKTLGELGVAVAHCPRSNIKLHGRTLNLPAILEHLSGRVGLGTDSLYSNDDLNMLNEARLALNAGVDLLTVLDMLTIDTARILKIDHLTGSIEKGKQADFLVFKPDNNLDYSAFANCEKPDNVFIAGKQLI